MAIYSEGPRDAKIVILGDAPGLNEVKQGRPFVGYSGELLDRMLERSGISRREVFLTNICHHQPPGGQFKWFSSKDGQVHLMRGLLQLKKDLVEIKPNIVTALGAEPLRVMTKKAGINNWRGSILESTFVPGLKTVGTYHPSQVMRLYDYKAVAEFDLRRVAEESTYPEIIRPKRELILDPAVELLDGLVLELLQAEWLGVDIECVEDGHGRWRLSCVGFSDTAERAVTIPCDHPLKIHAIRTLLASPVRKVMQNGTFDTTVLRDEGYEVNNFAWDTMLGHHALYAECARGEDELSNHTKTKRTAAFAKGLAFQTSLYTREPRYKDDGKIWKKTNDLQMFWRYNALDAVVTREIRDVQEKELREMGNLGVLRHSMSLVEPLMSMTRHGIKVDIPKRDAIRAKITGELDNLQSFLDKSAGQSINASSPDVKWLVYDKLGLPKQYKKRPNGTQTVTADEDALIKLSAKHPNPLLMTILKIRQRRKLIETYLDVAIDSDGRMRCSFDITGTRSGRLSSRASIYGSGTNLQNIPENLREMFIADPGMVFIYRDFSQAEARVVAALANDRYLLELFADPSRDIHKETAAKIFGIPLDQVTDVQRYLGKKVRHAVNYGMDARRFVEVVNKDAEETGITITESLARKVIDGFWLLHPNHKSVYWATVDKELRYSRTLTTPFGRKRTFFSRMDDKLSREGYSYIPQSTIGWLCNEAVANIYERVQISRADLRAQLMLQVHDSILVQCPKEHVREVNDLMTECMTIPFECNGHQILIPTDSKVGYNWGNRSKDGLTNPMGLRDISKWED
jgi:DNA polymerase-1